MGGLYGKMYHLHDNPSLKFLQIKDIFKKAANGEIKGTEKTDGQNIFLSFSVREGIAKAARNKQDLLNGGLNILDLRNRYAGRDEIEHTFADGLKFFEQVIVDKFDIQELIYLFGSDANIYYNAEIQDIRSSNIFHYDGNHITIHRVGHLTHDKLTNDIEITNLEERIGILEEGLNSDKVFIGEYSVKVNSFRNLNKLSDGRILNGSLIRLNNLQLQYSLDDKSTIGNFLFKRINEILLKKDIPKNVHNEVLKKLIRAPDRLKQYQILKYVFSPQEKEIVKNVLKDEKNIYKEAIYPLEDIIHDFSVQILKSLESIYILNNKKEIERLRKEVSNAIRTIEKSNISDAHDILKRQLKKIKDLDNISSAVEGFVFEYEGNTYKFTGNFAPMNQILGLFKYGRGNIPPLKTLNTSLKEDKSKIKTALYPGKFKPPHAGHFNVALQALQNAEQVIVFISPKEHDGITAIQSKKVWDTYIRAAGMDGRIVPFIVGVSPVTAVYDIIDDAPSGEAFLLLLGEKDKEDGRFKNTLKRREDIEVFINTIEPQAGGISATEMRGYLFAKDFENFKNCLPNVLDDTQALNLWNMFMKKKKNHFLDDRKTEDKSIEELSSMAGGGVSLSPAGDEERIIVREENDEELLNKVEENIPAFVASGSGKRDDNMIDRKEFLEELNEEKQLRSFIRRSIKLLEKKDEMNKMNENKLRSLIQKVLKEASQDIPHENTGINVLEGMLKKIIPIIETDYKSLTTDEIQRKSFRAHILKATQNALAPSQVTDEPPAVSDEQPNSTIAETDLDVNLSDEESSKKAEKFIDVDGDGVPDNQEHDTFSIPGEDETGRNFALICFQKIEKNIVDAYDVLSNEKDRVIFYDYLITNLKLYFDKFEDELRTMVTEPESELYNQEKAHLSQDIPTFGKPGDPVQTTEKPEEIEDDELDLSS